MSGGVAQQQIRIVIEAANYAGARGHIGKQQAPGDGRREPGRQGSSKRRYKGIREMPNSRA